MAAVQIQAVRTSARRSTSRGKQRKQRQQTRAQAQPDFSQVTAEQQRVPSPYEGRPVYVSPKDVSKSTILSASEMYQLTRVAYEAPNNSNPEAEAKEELRKRSENRYKNWGNTIEAQRQKKIKNRAKKLEDMELAQQELDKQETFYEDQKRRACIERANNILFQQQDNTKELQSSLIYSKVLQERGKQVMFHRQQQAQKEFIENMWRMQETEQLNQATEQANQAELARKNGSKQVAKEQLDQLRINQERMIKERKREIAEGAKIKALAEEAVRDAERADLARKEYLKKNNEEYVRANIEQQKLKAQRVRMEKREEERILEYAKEKERMDNKRKAHEDAVLKKKQDAYEAMIARQSDHLMMLKQKENARHEEMAKVLLKAGQDRVDREEKWDQARKDQVRESRQKQIRERAEEMDRQSYEDAIWAQECRRRTETMQMEAIAKERRIVEQNIENAEFLKRQSAGKRANRRLERIRDLEQAHIYKEKHKADDEMYMRYAEEQMEDFAAKGRSVVPMKLTLRKQEKRKTRLVVE